MLMNQYRHFVLKVNDNKEL